MLTIMKLLMVADEDDAVNQWCKHYCTCSNQTGHAHITCTYIAMMHDLLLAM